MWTSTRETDRAYSAWWWLRIVVGVRESRSPGSSHQSLGNGTKSLTSPVTKIARDNAERVLPREKRGNNFPELNFCFAIYRTDEDGNNGNIQPAEASQFQTTPLKLRSSPFKHLAHVGQMHLNAVLIFVGLYVHITKISRGTQFCDGCAQGSLITPAASKGGEPTI